jgi:hypothetical protein
MHKNYLLQKEIFLQNNCVAILVYKLIAVAKICNF